MQTLSARVAGQFAAQGEGVVCAVFKRSFYLRMNGDGAASHSASHFACVGDASIGRGPLNAIVDEFCAPTLGEEIVLSADTTWQPARLSSAIAADLSTLRGAAQASA